MLRLLIDAIHLKGYDTAPAVSSAENVLKVNGPLVGAGEADGVAHKGARELLIPCWRTYEPSMSQLNDENRDLGRLRVLTPLPSVGSARGMCCGSSAATV